MAYWNPYTRKCDPDTPKTWDTWTDVLGQTYGPGDFIAVAVINGRSPQMVIARVLQINRRNSKGEEHYETNSWYEDCDPTTPGAEERMTFDRSGNTHGLVGTGQWRVRRTLERPGATIKAQPLMDARDFSRYEGRAVTYQFWQNCIKVDGTEFERRAEEAMADLQALAEELA